MNYVIIGNSAAGIGAAESIRKLDSRGRLTIISDEPYHTYSRPLISYYLAGKVTAEQMRYRERNFYETLQIEALLGKKAESIAWAAKTVHLADGGKVPYDKLLLATGGAPVIPAMEGLDKQNVFTFLKLDDVKKIKALVRPGLQALVIGAGLIGLKAAESLVTLGAAVTVVELADSVLSSILDAEAGAIVRQHLVSQGLRLELQNSVQRIDGSNKVEGVTLQDGRQVACDLVVVAIGVKPNIALAANTPVQVNRGIIVDSRLQTSLPDIYAAGDVAEGFDMVYRQQRVLPILPNAYKQGEIAGLNMAGQEILYSGGYAMNAIEVLGLPMITAGLVKAPDSTYESMTCFDPQQNSYKQVILKDDIPVGFTAINSIDRAGILTGLIADRVNVAAFKEKLLNPEFGYIHLPKELRQSKMLEGGAACVNY